MDFSSMLGAVGDVLDKPRQMVYKGINAGYHALGGDPDTQIDHFADALGAAGMDKDSWLTKGLGFAGDMATDPLTYAGGFLGSKAFRALGPMHGGDAAKLASLSIPAEMADRGGVGMVQKALESPHASSILNEIPHGSTFQGAGAESLALRTPQGDVLRISPFAENGAVNIPNAAEINAPTRRMIHGNMEVSRTPLAQNVGDEALFNQHRPQLEAGLQRQGIDLYDFKPEDFGMVGGKPKVLDLGSIDPGANGPIQNIYGKTPLGFRAAGATAGGSAGVLARTLSGE